ncbi:hypothetical protein C2S52_003740 [Perilla frutescens var. hirtella]|nr:hypothetical protein C2S52_003740 [Perilla frutescens var. hirtella]
MHEIHVLYVDHEFNGVMNTTRLLLESCQYRVTHVELAADAMVMLSNGKVKFDFVIADINSPDLHGFKLLQLAVTMGIPTIMMSVDYDTNMAMKIIEIGALLYIKRPTTPEMLRCLWQHVARENLRVIKERDRLMAVNYLTPPQGIEYYLDENPNNNLFVMKENEKFKKQHVEEVYELDNNMTSHGKVRRKVCTEWTRELHEKFMDAVGQLGEGRCFPKEILEIMNVPGLTRMQVASHLQKCRNDNWRSPEERKSTLGMQPMSSDGDGEGSGHKPRRFGSMPRVVVKGQSSDYYRVGDIGSEGEMGNDRGGASYGALVPRENNMNNIIAPAPAPAPAPGINSSNPRHLVDHAFFNLDMDCAQIHNFSALPQPFAPTFNHPQSTTIYNDHHQTNSKGASKESRSHWSTSSETSNDYETTKAN